MTETRSKAVGRAAAAARKKKHDQKTPLPARGAKPVGNPTAEALADEVKKTPRKRASKAAAPVVAADLENGPSEDDMPADLDVRNGDDQASTVKTRRDAGETWRTISEALDLGPGKTGTSRARRLYRQANDGASAPRKEPKPRSSRHAGSPYADGMDTEHKPSRSRAASIPGYARENFRITARDKRTAKQRAGRPKGGDVNIEGLAAAAAASQRTLWEGDGYTVVVEKQVSDGTWVEVQA